MSSDSEAGDELFDELESNSTRPKRGGKASNGGYKLRNVLKLPRATTYTTQALYEQIISSDIDLEPEYQRDIVWSETKQIGLIDSILRNFYIPPVIFVSHQHEDGSETKTCVDGKQRLTSIQRFMDGQIPHKDPQSSDKYWYKLNAANQTGRSASHILPERYRRIFANKQIVCVEYQDLADSEEREIFQRVQLGMALTPAEKLQVVNTPIASFIRKLQVEYFGEDKPLGGDTLDWDRSRGGDFRCIAHALYSIAKYPSISTVGTVAQIDTWLHNPTRATRSKNKKKASDDDDVMEDELYILCIHDTFRVFSQLVGDRDLCPLFLPSSWRVSPVEFIAICLLISIEKDKLKPRALAEKIGRMRELVREEHVDIRMNSRVAKTLLDFIKGLQVANTSGTKRKLEEDALPDGRQPKAQKGDPLPAHSGAAVLPIPTLPPPRPSGVSDRLAAQQEAKKSISGPLTARLPPSAPAAQRNSVIGTSR
ncbi:hypothetical protein K503DRAFT_802153 [Rhizopogon vinicolor AM-OR11-026]|uniref:GmrSD restriction endonucleases N-terminal domain-containing protein n=1 Tax=Rhizopogon vinicolor AM-OR11-026 TaxID=1314800 RepID=A0A1B7MUN3_9AGAM|nr:hypothetical protein K503DRAFT_802153 [Rhizopogon vinicolor AM-OR11-026]